MTFDDIAKEIKPSEISKENYTSKRKFIEELEEFLRKHGFVKNLYPSADNELLTIEFYGGTRKEINIGRNSKGQIIKDLINAKVI